MDNHPIPQDVTGFQFKLVGDMTIKQFAYVAGGALCAWIFYIFPLPLLIKLPFAFLSGGTGVALAFLPVEGRPLDVMVHNFIKALFAQNLFMYKKIGGQHVAQALLREQPALARASSAKSYEELQAYLNRLPQKPKNALDQKEAAFFASLAQPLQKTFVSKPFLLQKPANPPAVSPPANPPVVAEPPIEEQEKALEQKEHDVEQKLETAKQEETKEATEHPNTLNPAHATVVSLEDQLKEIIRQKELLDQQLALLSQKIQGTTNPLQPPSSQKPAQPISVQEPIVTKPMMPPPRQKVPLPRVPDEPNVLAGIVLDSRGSVLPHILVEVKDEQKNPVRAFKTNRLGQFSSATPLLNGPYTIEVEDPAKEHKFQPYAFTVDGQIIQPVKITSVDKREELRRELFGA